jgi:hypothetical protein
MKGGTHGASSFDFETAVDSIEPTAVVMYLSVPVFKA